MIIPGRRVSLVYRDVELGPDWNGLGFSEGVPSTLKGDRIRLWQGEKAVYFPIEVEKFREPTAGWKRFSAKGGDVTGEHG